jgi:predicted Zn-dependent protease
MLASQNRPKEALDAFQAALDHGLKTPRVYVASAKMHFQLGNPAAAEQDLQSALAIEPNDREARELLQILQQGG